MMEQQWVEQEFADDVLDGMTFKHKIAEKKKAKALDKRYDQLQEQRQQSEDAEKYQDEIEQGRARQREAGRELCKVWERQRRLRAMAARVSQLY